MNKANNQLKAEIVESQLSITIGVETLIHAMTFGRGYGLGDIKIIDQEKFLLEVLSEIRGEREDGSTMVHEMLDEAVSNAIENGSEGVDYDD